VAGPNSEVSAFATDLETLHDALCASESRLIARGRSPRRCHPIEQRLRSMADADELVSDAMFQNPVFEIFDDRLQRRESIRQSRRARLQDHRRFDLVKSAILDCRYPIKTRPLGNFL
jgi:hypothetical protein